MKMTDCIGCFICNRVFKYFVRFIKRWIKSKNKNAKVKFDKPESMQDVPSSGDDSEPNGPNDDNNDTFKGLTEESIYLGEGATLYLQKIKTFAILFFILIILNLPLYSMLVYSCEESDFNFIQYDKNWKSDKRFF